MIIIRALENMLIRCIIHHHTSLLQSADQYSWGSACFWHFQCCWTAATFTTFVSFYIQLLIYLLSINTFRVVGGTFKGRCHRHVRSMILRKPLFSPLVVVAAVHQWSILLESVKPFVSQYRDTRSEKNNHFLVYLHWCPWGKRQSSQWLHITFLTMA